MEDKKVSPKRLVIDINEEMHTKIKIHAAKRNISIRKWAIRAILKAIKDEEQYE